VEGGKDGPACAPSRGAGGDPGCGIDTCAGGDPGCGIGTCAPRQPRPVAVAGWPDVLASLLGQEVPRKGDVAGTGHAGVGQPAGDAEVNHPRSVRGEQHVLRLEVTVDQPG
jgi:hypothetical protein